MDRFPEFRQKTFGNLESPTAADTVFGGPVGLLRNS